MAVKRKKTPSKAKKDAVHPPEAQIRQELAPAQPAKGRIGSFVKAVIVLCVIAAAAFFFANPSFWNPEKAIKSSVDKAEKFSVHRNYKKALKIYEGLVTKWGKSKKHAELMKQVRLNLAKTYQDAAEYLKAINLYKQLAEEYKSVNQDMHAWLLLELGASYAGMFNTSEAIKTYQSVVDNYKGSDWAAEALFGIADAYKAAGDTAKALKFYSVISEKYKKGFLSAEALTNMGQIYEREGKPKKALEIYSRIIKEFPDVVTEYAKLRYESLVSKAK